jgi:hypothetical protein
MEVAHPFTSKEMEMYREVTDLSVRCARPLIWHDAEQPWPKRLLGATCFVLRFDVGLIGVTADHVVRAFEDAVVRVPTTVCLLRTARLDLASAMVDRDAELDVATFTVTEDQLIESKAIAIDCRLEWPPPTPDRGRELSVAGFPQELAGVSPYHNVEFRAYASLCRVEDVTDRDIITTYEPQRDFRIRSALEFPILGANLSGCSGGPVLMHILRNGMHRWFAVGLLVEGPRALSDAETREFDTYTHRRLHFIKADGSIEHPNHGWLPPRPNVTRGQ